MPNVDKVFMNFLILNNLANSNYISPLYEYNVVSTSKQIYITSYGVTIKWRCVRVGSCMLIVWFLHYLNNVYLSNLNSY